MPGAARNRGGTRGRTGRGSVGSDTNLVASGARVGSAKRGVEGVTKSRGSRGKSGKPTNTRTPGSGQRTKANKDTDESSEEENNRPEKTSQKDGIQSVKEKKENELLQTKLEEAVATRRKLEDEFRDLTLSKEARINELKTENDELRTRLSSHLGAQLQNMNPNIADLSDTNRPTRLAERFSSLYDDEWTNSFEIITNKEKRDHDDAVSRLLQACVEIYKKCIATASEELGTLHRILAVFNSDSDVTILKQLKDKRKKYTFDEREQKGIELIDIKREMNAILGAKLLKHKDIQTFCRKCLDICWLMAVQDPPVFMDTDINKRKQTFDNDAYKPYTKSGPLVDFIVWPALYLVQGGHLLSKGVAQGLDSE